MSWPQAYLGDVLSINPSPISILERELYKQASLKPYPRGIVLKTVKKGLDFPQKRQKMVQAGQFVISKSQVALKAWGIVPQALDGAVIAKKHLIFDLHVPLDPDYFAVYLSTPLFRRAAFSACSTYGSLNVQQFREIVFPLPTLDDQQRVVALWQHAHKALTHTAEMVASLQELRANILKDVFQKANPAWERKTLGEYALIGHDLTGNYPLSVAPPDQINLGAPLFDDGGIGIKPDVEVESPFLYYYLESQKTRLRELFEEKRPHVEAALRTLPLPVPTLYEQRKILTVMQQNDDALSQLHTEQTALRKLIQGIMHLIFNGSLNLQEASQLLQNL